ncbi:asparaginase domain-containing protein [Sodalis-like endosymbiont of Proechinophthirus fluctus]|uniref:asparaginase domain-containing protein n=1 Tax=Sodalis-like endosymbiont of Proechinophthirus fluctus TaxID=1462730 RepID=UPI0009391CA8
MKLEHLNNPVIVTGSQIPLEALNFSGQTNYFCGKTNLLNALYLAAHYPVKEVSGYFSITNCCAAATRTITAHVYGFDAFASPNFPPLLDGGKYPYPPSYAFTGKPGKRSAYRASYYAPARRGRGGHSLPRYFHGHGRQLSAPADLWRYQRAML